MTGRLCTEASRSHPVCEVRDRGCVYEVPRSIHVNERRGETAHRRLRRRLRVAALREPRVFWALFLFVSEWPIGNGQCQSVSQLFHGPAPPRAHPSTGSQSGQCLA